MFYDSVTKQARNSYDHSWDSSGFDESTTMCNDLFRNTAVESRINHKLVKNTPNSAKLGHELTEIWDYP